VYVDTTILILCTAEIFTPDSPRFLLRTLETARQIGIKIRTFRPFMQEYVAHLKGPVLLEWFNHFQGRDVETLGGRFQTAPTLIRAFHKSAQESRRSVEQLVYDIIGRSNNVENVTEFFKEEIGITTEEIPTKSSGEDQTELETIFGVWLAHKRRWPNMEENRFELLVRNDVNAYTAVRRLRREVKLAGPDYGHQMWLLTLDRMYWKMPRLLGTSDDHGYHVAMSIDYLVNFVATLANINLPGGRDTVLPSNFILQESESIPTQLRAIVAEEWDSTNRKRYLKNRRIRDLVHEAKTHTLARAGVETHDDEMEEIVADEDIGFGNMEADGK